MLSNETRKLLAPLCGPISAARTPTITPDSMQYFVCKPSKLHSAIHHICTHPLHDFLSKALRNGPLAMCFVTEHALHAQHAEGLDVIDIRMRSCQSQRIVLEIMHMKPR